MLLLRPVDLCEHKWFFCHNSPASTVPCVSACCKYYTRQNEPFQNCPFGFGPTWALTTVVAALPVGVCGEACCHRRLRLGQMLAKCKWTVSLSWVGHCLKYPWLRWVHSMPLQCTELCRLVSGLIGESYRAAPWAGGPVYRTDHPSNFRCNYTLPLTQLFFSGDGHAPYPPRGSAAWTRILLLSLPLYVHFNHLMQLWSLHIYFLGGSMCCST